jgi:hypothetical protein
MDSKIKKSKENKKSVSQLFDSQSTNCFSAFAEFRRMKLIGLSDKTIASSVTDELA